MEHTHHVGYFGHNGHQEADMPKQVTIAEARDQLSAHVRSAEHGMPVVITRRGRAVAAIVAAEEFERLERLRAAGRRPASPASRAAGRAPRTSSASSTPCTAARRARPRT
jgi:prevent-host-death family protein